MRWARRWFRLLLRSFPAGFRERYGPAMEEAFREASAERRARGLLSLARFLVRTTVDMTLSGLRERFGSRHAAGRKAQGSVWAGWPVSWVEVKLGLRMLSKHPGLAVASTFALAVGIPVGLAPDQVVDGVMANLPVPEGERIRLLRQWDPRLGRSASASYGEFDAWRESLTSFEDLAAFRRTRHNVDGGAEIRVGIRAAEVTPSTFEILRVPPFLGRTFRPEDASPGAPDVVVLAYDLWQARYAGDLDVVGRTIRLGETPFTVVGVMPEGFLFPVREQLWTPLGAPDPERAASLGVDVVGRLADGVTDAEAGSEFTVVAGRTTPSGDELRLQPQVARYAQLVLPALSGPLEETYEVRVFRILAWLVFLVASCNVGMLFFARAATRREELAVRTALGAARPRVLAQAFMESLVLALAAVGAGLVLCSLAFDLLWRVVPSGWEQAFPHWIDWRIDNRTVFRALTLATISAVVAGVIPAIRYTTRSVQANIQSARSRRTGVRFGGVSGMLIAVDVAVAVAAVGFSITAADLVTRVSGSTELVGIPAHEYLAAEVHLGPSDGPGPSASTRRAATQEELVRRLRAEPGVRGVAVADALPRMQHPTRLVEVEGMAPPEDRRGHSTRVAQVAPDFFASLDAPLLTGRGFDRSDLGPERTTVVVNTRFVENILQGQSALGRRIRFHPWGEGEPGPWKEIVGVVGQLGVRIVSAEGAQGVYEPLDAGELRTVQLGIHLGADPTSFSPRLRALAAEVDPEAIVSVSGTLGEIHEGDWYLVLAASLGAGLLVGVLLALAASGIFAILSFSVSERITEIGIRAALGAGQGQVIASVTRRAAAQLGIGVALGLPLAAGFLLLEQSSPFLGLAKALAVGLAVLLLVGLAACTGPTLRALRVRPSDALRADG